MLLKKVEISQKSDVDFIEQIYIESFPPNERRPVVEFLRLLQDDKTFTVYLILDDDKRVGFLTTWTFDTFIYAEHFAIAPEYRSAGYGKEVMEAFIGQTTLPIILEVETPENELAKRRIAFYERVGFKAWNIPYTQPAYEEKYGPVPMVLMTYRTIALDKLFDNIKSLIYKKVYNVNA